MEGFILQPAALDELEVESTAPAPTDSSLFIFEEWCQMTELQKTETLLNQQDLTGAMYVNTDLEFQSISIISYPAHRLYWDEWRVGQIGNRLSRSPESMLFNLDGVCGSIVVPMQELPYAKQLGLLYDSTKIISADNCRFWTEFDLEKDFPGKEELPMATLPCVFLYGQGAVVPQSFDDLLKSIESSDNLPPILNGKLAPGVADALRALKKNDFNSFFGQDNRYGAAKNVFHTKNFKNIVSKPPFFTNMLFKEKNCTRTSPNSQRHNDNFNDTLNRALRYTKEQTPSKYNEAVEKYVTPRRNFTRRVVRRNEDYDDKDSNDSSPPKKLDKKEDVDMDYMERFYRFPLGQKSMQMQGVSYNGSKEIACTLFLVTWKARVGMSRKSKASDQSGTII